MNADHISPELLNAFVDGELDAAEKARLLTRIAADSALKDRVCELWQLKELVGQAYPPAPAAPAVPRRRRHPWPVQALAAALILGVGVNAGWLLHDQRPPSAAKGPGFALLDDAIHGTQKVVLHVFSGEDIRFEGALDAAEAFINQAQAQGRRVELDIVANGEGLRLLRADFSPYAERIKTLRQAHHNLRFYACGVTLQRLREKGAEVRLLPEVEITPSALEWISTRERQGWRYVQS